MMSLAPISCSSRSLFAILVFAGIFASCRDKQKIPSGILSQAKMENVLWDMVLADRFAAQYLLKDSATKDVNEETFRLYSKVFSLNEISSEQFLKSYKFYMTRPDLTKIIIDTIMQRSNRLKEDSYRPKMDNAVDSAGLNSKPTVVPPADSAKVNQ